MGMIMDTDSQYMKVEVLFFEVTVLYKRRSVQVKYRFCTFPQFSQYAKPLSRY